MADDNNQNNPMNLAIGCGAIIVIGILIWVFISVSSCVSSCSSNNTTSTTSQSSTYTPPSSSSSSGSTGGSSTTTTPPDTSTATPDASTTTDNLSYAWQAVDRYGEQMYPYGFKLHYIAGKLAEEKQGDRYFLKATCDVKNEFGTWAKGLDCEAYVSGSGTNWTVDSFNVY